MKAKNLRNLIIGFTLFASVGAIAQPDWKRVNYETSTVFTGVVSVNGVNASAQDMVGIFVNNECRMVTKIIMVNDTSYVSAVIHSAGIPEHAIIKFWDSFTNTVYTLDTIVPIQNHGSVKKFPIEIKSESQTETPNTIVAASQDALRVYPSPFTNSITVESTKTVKQIDLFNSIGKRIVSRQAEGQKVISIDTNNFASGLYLVSIEFEDGSVVTKKVFKK